MAEIHFELGNVYLCIESPERAIESLKHTLELRHALGTPEDDRDIALCNSLGIAYKQLGMREEAKEYYEKAIRMTHEGRKSQLNLVNPLCNLGYLMQAEGNN